MIKVKLKDLIDSKDSLISISKEKIPCKLSFKFSDLIEEVEPKLKNYELTRNKKIADYGETNEEGRLQVKQENLPLFIKEHDDLLDMEISLECEKAKRSEFGESEVIPADLYNCRWFIEK